MAVAACPHCGHESEADVCPLCGSEMSPGAAGDGGGPDVGRAGPVGEGRGTADARSAGTEGARPVPWEDPSLGFPLDAWRSWRESLFEPTAFFRRIDHDGALSRPVLYFLLVSVLGAFFHLLWQAYLYAPLTGDAGMYGGGFYVVQFFATPFAVLFFLGVQTLILHLFVLMLAPEHRSMGSTARVICYASGPAVLAAVPLLGSLVAGIWGLVLQVVGIREAHRTSTGRAAVVVLAPVFLALGAAVFLGVVAALMVGQGELASTATGVLPLP